MLGKGRNRYGFLRTLLGIVRALLGVRHRGARGAISTAFDRPLETALGRGFAAAAAGRSAAGPAGTADAAFVLLEDGPAAFLARADLCARAERAIDLQYYIYAGDRAGSVLAYELLRAAERGVRVRLLLDDNGIGFRDAVLAELDAHRNVEVRVFNPTTQRGGLARVVEFLTRVSRLNRRMHNKIMTVDGVAAIVGGRNIGDHYFGARFFGTRHRLAFRDYDALMFGAPATEAGASFDRFWNSEHAVTVTAIGAGELPEARAAALAARLARGIAKVIPDYETRRTEARAGFEAWFRAQRVHWASGRVVSESPERIAAEEAGGGGGQVLGALAAALAQAQREVLIESAYFVPQDDGVAFLAALVRRGVRVTVLTNALASNDVPAVHAGYARYREALLAAGVRLHEFRRRPRRRSWALLRRREQETSLHAKVMVIDGRLAWIGSFNMDPRSARLNTEVGVLIDSPSFAAELAGHIAADIAPEHAWTLALEPDPAGVPVLTWTGLREGVAVRFRQEPEVGRWARAKQLFFRSLPGFEDSL